MLLTVYCVRRDLSEVTFSLQVDADFELHNFRALCELESGIPAAESQVGRSGGREGGSVPGPWLCLQLLLGGGSFGGLGAEGRPRWTCPARPRIRLTRTPAPGRGWGVPGAGSPELGLPHSGRLAPCGLWG